MEKEIIISAIKDHVYELSMDTYGTHVLEKILASFEEDLTGFLCDYVDVNFISLANHSNGLCIVKKVLMMNHKQELHEKLKKYLIDNAMGLVQNPYGNYALQVTIDVNIIYNI
jgi:hypothetical protein